MTVNIPRLSTYEWPMLEVINSVTPSLFFPFAQNKEQFKQTCICLLILIISVEMSYLSLKCGSIFGKRALLAIDHIMLALFWSYVPNMK